MPASWHGGKIASHLIFQAEHSYIKKTAAGKSSGGLHSKTSQLFRFYDLGRDQRLFAVFFLHGAGDSDFFGRAATDFAVEGFGFFAGEVIADFLAIHGGFHHRLAFIRGVQRALGATGVAGDGDFLGVGGKRGGGDVGNGQADQQCDGEF